VTPDGKQVISGSVNIIKVWSLGMFSAEVGRREVLTDFNTTQHCLSASIDTEVGAMVSAFSSMSPWVSLGYHYSDLKAVLLSDDSAAPPVLRRAKWCPPPNP